jgi:hypothetical protein
MDMLDKGVLLRTIEVTDPKVRFKRNYLLFVPISSTMVFALVCTILWFRGLPLELIGLVLALALSMEIVSLVVISWALGRSCDERLVSSREQISLKFDLVVEYQGIPEQLDPIQPFRISVSRHDRDDNIGVGQETSMMQRRQWN